MTLDDATTPDAAPPEGSAGQGSAVIVGAGAVACVACCAGPILGVLAAIGLGTAAGLALFGVGALLVGGGGVAFVVTRRRRRASACPSTLLTTTPLELGRPRV